MKKRPGLAHCLKRFVTFVFRILFSVDSYRLQLSFSKTPDRISIFTHNDDDDNDNVDDNDNDNDNDDDDDDNDDVACFFQENLAGMLFMSVCEWGRFNKSTFTRVNNEVE